MRTLLLFLVIMFVFVNVTNSEVILKNLNNKPSRSHTEANKAHATFAELCLITFFFVVLIWIVYPRNLTNVRSRKELQKLKVLSKHVAKGVKL